MRKLIIRIGARIKELFNRAKLEKDDISREMTYAMFCNALNKPNAAETLKEYVRNGRSDKVIALLQQKQTILEICRIVLVMHCYGEKSFEDFFVEMKKVLGALETQLKLK